MAGGKYSKESSTQLTSAHNYTDITPALISPVFGFGEAQAHATACAQVVSLNAASDHRHALVLCGCQSTRDGSDLDIERDSA